MIHERENEMDQQPTKTTGTRENGLIVEYDSKCSVEIMNTVKDGPRIAVVKAYGNTVAEASQAAIEGFYAAQALLAKNLPVVGS